MQLRLRLVAADHGAPLGDAQIGVGWFTVSSREGRLVQARSDAAGLATLDLGDGAGAADVRATLFVAARGREAHVESLGPGLAGIADAERVVTLRAGPAWTGVVVDESGTPVEGATISLLCERKYRAHQSLGDAPHSMSFGPDRWPPECRTAADGRFAWTWWSVAWRDTADERWLLSVEHPDCVPAGVEASDPGRELRVVLARGLQLAGEVVTRESEPVAGAEVEALFRPGRGAWMSEVYRKNARGDAAGRFVLRGLRAGPHELRVLAPGLAQRNVTVDPRRAGAVRLALAPGSVLEGVVLDAHGVPLSRCDVRVESGWRRIWRLESTDAQGRFRIDSLPRNVRLDVQGGFSSRAMVRLPAPPLVLRPCLATLRVRVVAAATEAPLAGAVVTFAGRSLSSSFTTDADGHGQRELVPGIYQLFVGAEGHAHAWRLVRLRAGRPDRPRTVRLRKGRTLTGTVRAPDGAPIAGCAVVAQRSFLPLDRHEAVTDADGRYRLQHLAGAYEVVFVADGYRSALARCRLGRWSRAEVQLDRTLASF